MTVRAPVVMVNDVAGVGGGQQVMLDVAIALSGQDVPVVILCPDGWLAERAREAGLGWRQFSFMHRRMLGSAGIPRPVAVAQRWRDGRALDAQLDDLGAKILHAGALVPQLASMAVRREGARRIVWHVNQVSPRALFAGRLPDRIIAVSKASLAPATWRSTARQRSVVVSNAIDTERFKPLDVDERAETRRSLGFGPSTLVALTIARLEPSKGVHTLVDVVSRCATRPVLVVVGGTPDGGSQDYEREVRRHAEALDVEVRILGERSDPERLLGACDLFVFASAWEAFGLVLAEAASCGLAVVSGSAGGCREVVADGVGGYLVELDDPSAFAARIDMLLADPVLRRAMGNAGRADALARFGMPAFRRAIIDAYRDPLEWVPCSR